jgi:hypothetical protein
MLAQAIRSVGFTDFYHLAPPQQMILADCVDRGIPQIALPASNVHADYLCRIDWLQEEVSVDTSVRMYTIPPARWSTMRHIREEILTPSMKSQLVLFRNTLPNHYGRAW